MADEIGSSFKLSTLTPMQGLLQACDMSSGNLSGILINRDIVKAIFDNQREAVKTNVDQKKDVSKLSMDVFFNEIFKLIKEMSGGAFDLEIVKNEELSSTATKTTVLDIRNRREAVKDIVIKPLKFEPRDGTTIDMSVQSKLSADLIASTYASHPGSGTEGSNTAAISARTKQATDPEKPKEGLPSATEINQIRGKIITSVFSDESVNACKSVMKRLVSDQSLNEAVTKENTLIPLELTLKIYGIGNIRFGDTVTTSMLPKRYRDTVGNAKVGFTVIGVSHTLTGEQGIWTTEIKSVQRMIDASNYDG